MRQFPLPHICWGEKTLITEVVRVKPSRFIGTVLTLFSFLRILLIAFSLVPLPTLAYVRSNSIQVNVTNLVFFE